MDSPSLNWIPMFSETRIVCDIPGSNKLSGLVGEYRQVSWNVSLWLGFVKSGYRWSLKLVSTCWQVWP